MIELCSKCSLECPRCLRQEQGFQTPHHDLDVDWFKKNFVGKLLTDVRKITFSGVRGDPIYAKHLLEVLQYIRSHNDKVQFVIITNGSYKTQEWWYNLSSILNDKDHIHFSLDGWDQKSNELYRVNCNWDSIVTGIKALSDSDCYKTWAAIVFKFNQHKIDDMMNLARELRFDEFQITYSAKFHKVNIGYPEDDPLQPNDEYISSRFRHDRQYHKLTNKLLYDPVEQLYQDRFDSVQETTTLMPLCKIGNKGLYINAVGDFYPCCWTEPNYEAMKKNIFNHIADSQKELSLADKMNDRKWTKVFSYFDKPTNMKGFEMCHTKCTRKHWNLDHATKF